MRKVLSLSAGEALPNYTLLRIGKDSFATFSPTELVRFRLSETVIERFPLRAPEFTALDDAELSPQFRLVGAALESERLLIYSPTDQSINRFTSDGHLINKLRAPFEVLSIAPWRDGAILTFGPFAGHLLHELNHEGAVVKSSLPLPRSYSSFAASDQDFCDRRILVNENGVFVLRDSRAGIIDHLDPRSLDLRRRFILTDRKRSPIFQLATSAVRIAPSGVKSGAQIPQLYLTFPSMTPQIQSLASTADGGVAALLSNGAGLLLFSKDLTFIRALQFPRLHTTPRTTSQRIFSILFADAERLIACSPNGDIWLLNINELHTTPADAIDLNWGTKVGHPLSPSGSPALLSTDEVMRFATFWEGIPPGEYVFEISIARDGSAKETESTSASSSNSEVEHRILAGLEQMQFTPHILSGHPTSATVEVHVTIDPSTHELTAAAAGKLVRLH